MYSSLIVQAHRKYSGDNWQVYDRNFHLQAAARQPLSWAHIDPSLWTMAFANVATNQHCQWCLSLDHPTCECPDRGTDASIPICRRWNWMECSQSSCQYRHVCSGCMRPDHKERRCPLGRRGDPQGLSCTHHSTNEAHQGRCRGTTHQTRLLFAAIEDVILGSSKTLTRNSSTRTHTSDRLKHSYDSDSMAHPNQPGTKSSEGLIHNVYNPTVNLHHTHKVFNLTQPDCPLKLQSTVIHINQQFTQAKKDRQYFINLTTQPQNRGTSGQSSSSISLHPMGQNDHYPSCTQYHHAFASLTPPSTPAYTARTTSGPSYTLVSTQDGHTGKASLNPERTLRMSSAVFHRFSQTTATVMESLHYPYTADLLSLDECRPVVPSHTLTAECCRITIPLNIHQWCQLLVQHPDKHLCEYIISGISQGFRISFNRNTT